MTVYKTFVAEDGTEFDTEEECLAYEQAVSETGMRFFDSKLKEIKTDTAVTAADNAYFIVVENDEQAMAFISYLRSEYGTVMPCPVSDGQVWGYDAEKETWLEIHEIIEGYQGILAQLGYS